MNRKEKLKEFKESLKKRGLRLTTTRKKILEILAETKKHLSPEEIYSLLKKSCPSAGYATVYRTLKVLTDEKMVRKRKFHERTSVYEPVIDEKKHHDHLICVRCGAIKEFEEEKIEKLQDSIAKKFGFTIEDHKLELYGLCPSCKKTLSRKKP